MACAACAANSNPIRIADGENQIAYGQVIGVSEGQRGEVSLSGINLQHREIGALVGDEQIVP